MPVCKSCHSDKPIRDFYMRPDRKLDKVCKECRIKAVNERRVRIKAIEDETIRQLNMVFGDKRVRGGG